MTQRAAARSNLKGESIFKDSYLGTWDQGTSTEPQFDLSEPPEKGRSRDAVVEGRRAGHWKTKGCRWQHVVLRQRHCYGGLRLGGSNSKVTCPWLTTVFAWEAGVPRDVRCPQLYPFSRVISIQEALKVLRQGLRLYQSLLWLLLGPPLHLADTTQLKHQSPHRCDLESHGRIESLLSPQNVKLDQQTSLFHKKRKTTMLKDRSGRPQTLNQ